MTDPGGWPPEPPGGWIETAPPPDPSTPPPGGPPVDPPTAPTPARRWLPLVLGVALVLAAAGGIGAFVLGDDGPSHPDEWAADVLPYVEIVQDERNLDFVHPVHVELLSEEDFRAEVTGGETELSDEDREELDDLTGLLRAVGLVEGELDLFEAVNDLVGEGTLGYYSYDDERVRVRGEEITPAVASTLVHELTHALQDQHFDLGARFDELDDADDGSARSTAFEALVEGDASRIEAAYEDTLSAEERAALDEERDDSLTELEEATGELPPVLEALMGAPYALGEAMLALAVEVDGNDAVDRLFADPPVSDEHLLDPWTLLLGDDQPLGVTEPTLAEGEEELDRDTFGMLAWYLMLAERVDLVTALDAADGWGGDAMVGFRRDGATCVRVHHRADTAEDSDEMQAALAAWIAALPDSPASVERVGAELVFESCDPGTGADVGTGSSIRALRLAVTRTYLAATFLQDSGQDGASRCFADALVHEFSLDVLSDPDVVTGDPAVQQQIQQVAIDCL